MQTPKDKNHKLSWLFTVGKRGQGQKKSDSKKKAESDPKGRPAEASQVPVDTSRVTLHRRIDYRMRTELHSLEDSLRHSVHRADRDAKRFHGRSQEQNERNMAFVNACKNREYDEANKLLAKNHIDVEAQDITNMAAIHYAAWHGKKEFLKMLVETGVDPNIRGFEGRGPLHFAAMFNHRECIELLVGAGAEVELVDEYSWTPLHYAAASDSPSAINVLLTASANPSRQDDYGLTPVDLSASEEVDLVFSKEKEPVRRGSCSGANPQSDARNPQSSIYFTRAKQRALQKYHEQQEARQAQNEQVREERQQSDTQPQASSHSTSG